MCCREMFAKQEELMMGVEVEEEVAEVAEVVEVAEVEEVLPTLAV